MGVDDDGSFLFQQRSGDFLNSQFPQTMSSMSTTPSSSANVYDQFLATDWNPLILVDQDVDFNGSTDLSSYNVRIAPSLGNNHSNVGEVKQIPMPSIFNNECFPEIVSSFILSESNQVAGARSPPEIPSTNKHGVEKNLKGKKRKILSECTTLPPHSPLDEKDVSPESVKNPRERDEKKKKSELNPGVNAQEPTQIDDASREDYIHVRAKRGQAANSHSLAERVRREKISERMRVLQDLVPGCNKITGKAVMLDEIINYVQSLQRQVECLSMKLAAVNPELNFDIEQILSKDILHSRDGSSAVLGLGPGMNTFHPLLYGHGLMQTEISMCNVSNSGEMMRATIPQVSLMPQISSAWDDELQNAVEMGFLP